MVSPAPSPAPASPPAAPAPASRWARTLAYRRLWILALVIFVVDQLTKIWIVQRMPLGTYGPPGGITVIEGFFYLVHVGNTGAAWSLFTGRSGWLALFALATLGAIYLWRETLELRSPVIQTAFGLLCGGIVGNLVDRLVHGHVVDFLDFHFGRFVYPTFNVADSGICIGVGLYLIHSLRHPPEPAGGSSG